ncbi:MAG: deoxyribose-phosphate aldolase [Polyangia bacterium]
MSVDHALAALIDHTLLRPDAVDAEIDQLCDEARAFGFRTVCVQPTFVRRAAARLAGSSVGVTVVVAFPHGAATTAVKVYETERAIADGATEIDMVANLGWIRGAATAAITNEVSRVVSAAGTGGALVKVILETALFPVALKEAAGRAALDGGAAFLKTSTGYGPGGATVDDVALLRRLIEAARPATVAGAGPAVGVKASGGIKTRAQAQAMLAAGATRLGASASVALVTLLPS